MNQLPSNRSNKFNVRVALVTFMVIANGSAYAFAFDLEGFTEPYRTINVAADESGIIEEVLVREGDTVQAGQPLARLNSDVHRTLLAISEHSMQAEGRLNAAQADLQLRQDRFRKLQSLRADGHARQEELERAASELAVAEANVKTAREEQLTKALEYERFRVQLDRRTVRAPVSGIVTKLHKQLGEFVAPNNPDVLTLVQPDPLLANFTFMSHQVTSLKMGQPIKVRMLTGGEEASGTVEFIAPTVDAESGTVRVKIRIENPNGQFRSGERCKIQF